MSACRNVLLIVVDQWRGLMLPKLGADYLKLPNIDRLCAEGVTFRNHFTQCVPCGPARASSLPEIPVACSRSKTASPLAA
jgi:arylsulfatase A-like enzyme